MWDKHKTFHAIDVAVNYAIAQDDWAEGREEVEALADKFYEDNFQEKRPRWQLAYLIARLMHTYASMDWEADATKPSETKAKGEGGKMNNTPKKITDFTVEDSGEFIGIMIDACKRGVKIGLSPRQLAMGLQVIADRLMVGDHDLQYYVDHPAGDRGQPITEDELAKLRAKAIARGAQ